MKKVSILNINYLHLQLIYFIMKTVSRLIFVLIVLAYITAISLLTSCTGAKNMSKSEEKNDSLSIIKKELIVKQLEIKELRIKDSLYNLKIKQINNDIVINEGTIEPVDPTKPASFIDPTGRETKLNNSKWSNKKTEDKSSFREEELQVQVTTLESENTVLKEELERKEEELRVLNLKKESQLERKQWTLIKEWWFWLILLILLLAGWLTYKYYTKGLNPLQLITSIIKKKQDEKTDTQDI